MSWNDELMTLEDANSIIAHFSRGFTDYYTLDTREMSTDDYFFAYDFISLVRTTDLIRFTVKNSLWTGGYFISDCNIENYSVAVADDVITVTGTGLTWVELCLELSPEFNYGDYLDLELYPVFTPVIQPFYETINLDMGFYETVSDDPISGLSVTDMITEDSLTTDSTGYVSVSSTIDKHGEYDYILETENNGETVDYNFPYLRIKSELPVALLNTAVYSNKVNTLEFEFLFDDSYDITDDMLFTDNTITLLMNNVEYELLDYEDHIFRFQVPFGDVSTSNLQLAIEGNDYLEAYNVDFNNVTVEALVVEDTSELIAELSSDNPAEYIEFSGTEITDEITVTSEVTLVFQDTVTSSLDTVFTVEDEGVLTLKDSIFSNGKTLANVEGDLIVTGCTISHCTSSVITGSGSISVSDSSFIDNTLCISCTGDLTCKTVLFSLEDTSYYDSSKVAFIEAYGTELTIDYCSFTVDLTGVSTLGFGYVFLMLGKDCLANNIQSNQLLQNNSFPSQHCTGEVDVESTSYYISSTSNKAMIWSVEDTNTVYNSNVTFTAVE